MKKLETIIHPLHCNETRAALESLGVSGTLRPVETFGRTPPRREVYRGSSYVVDTVTEVELTVIVRDEMLDRVLAALAETNGDAERSIITTVASERAPLLTAATRATTVERARLHDGACTTVHGGTIERAARA